jgi:hypothetical protein
MSRRQGDGAGAGMRPGRWGIGHWMAVTASWCLVAPAPGGEPVSWGDSVKPGHAVWIRVLQVEDDAWLSVRTEFVKNEPSRLAMARSGNRCRTWNDLALVTEPGRNLDKRSLPTA